MAKIYVVRKGRKTGMFNTWKECEEQVKGFSGADFKSFTSKSEAEKYLSGNSTLNEKVELVSDEKNEKNSNEIIAYVDGSYNIRTKEYGSGVVILHKIEKKTYSIKGEDPTLAEMRNVAGEIKGAEIAMQYAFEKKVAKVIIYHDYEGIEKWCTGSWKTNKIGTKKYKEFYNDISQYIKVEFIKVKAHSGDYYNEEADKLAKSAIGLI